MPLNGTSLARAYFDGLKRAYHEQGAGKEWDHFIAAAHGAGGEDLDTLKVLYPHLPASLAELLCLADGTYYREYRAGEKICLSFLGSDLEEFPYYLLSTEQMAKTKDDFQEWGDYLIKREFGDPVDERITNDLEHLHWLHFADCRNNGGSSQLFIDFSPSEKGTSGQIIRYLHDPDELAVIADSFDGYLELLMENEYDFICEDTVEE